MEAQYANIKHIENKHDHLDKETVKIDSHGITQTNKSPRSSKSL
jgi:hypothetical protein